MNLRKLFVMTLSLTITLGTTLVESVVFVPTQEELVSYYDQPNIVMIASPGRSGSTLLTETIEKYATQYAVLKSHLLPPKKNFQGKIVFIFSNPDKAAESALHLTIQNRSFGASHFIHVESADRTWLVKIGNTTRQSELHNLLGYDALGSDKQLLHWLYQDTKSCTEECAQVLAIKYEHLWDSATQDAIKYFLGCPMLDLPLQKSRGYTPMELSAYEKIFRKKYNTNVPSDPHYPAYDKAREKWQKAPPFQFLELNRD